MGRGRQPTQRNLFTPFQQHSNLTTLQHPNIPTLQQLKTLTLQADESSREKKVF